MGDTGRPWYWKYWKATGKDKDILVRKTRIQGQPQDESDRDELGENTVLIEFVLKRRSEHLKLLTGSSWSSWVIMYIIMCLMNWLLLRKSCIDAISRVVKISAITAIKGGTDKKIGSQATHVQKYFSNPDSSGTEKSIKAVGAKTTATWVIAIAAPHHATGNSDLLSGFITKHDDMFVHAVDGVPMQVDACGAVVTDAMTLPDVWVVPGLTANVVSVSQLAELDYSVRFGGGACYIRSATDGTVVGKAHLVEGGLYVLDFLKIPLAL